MRERSSMPSKRNAIALGAIVALVLLLSMLHRRQGTAPLPPSGDIKYLASHKLLIATAAKAGSTTTWAIIYRGLFNSSFSCKSYVQDTQSACWHGQLRILSSLSGRAQRAALRNPDVFRVAVWRHPFDRLVSGYKSKLACGEGLGTDGRDRAKFLPILRQQAGLPPKYCLGLVDFGETLSALAARLRAGSLRFDEINPHFRPAEFHMHHLTYDLILDVQDLASPDALGALVNRLPYPEAALGKALGSNVLKLHASPENELWIPQTVARQIADFAALTDGSPQLRQTAARLSLSWLT